MIANLVEGLAHATVRIECDLGAGGTSVGTGFFYALKENELENTFVPILVTNKHVVKGATKVKFVLTLRDPDGTPKIGSVKEFNLAFDKCGWRAHPDADVDLCAMPIGPHLNKAEKEYAYRYFNKTSLPSPADLKDMGGIETIVMVGYPDGLWDGANNLPIFRKGIIASDYKRDWNGKKEFLIDAACFLGSSGSPVILWEIGGYPTSTGMTVGCSRIKLLGVLYACEQHAGEGGIKVVEVPTQKKAISIAGIPNNLGIVIKAEQLLAFEEVFK